MDLDEIKKILEEKYISYDYFCDMEPEEFSGEILVAIEEIYTEIFSQEEFDEFIKRKEERPSGPFKFHMGLLSGSSGAIEDCLL